MEGEDSTLGMDTYIEYPQTTVEELKPAVPETSSAEEVPIKLTLIKGDSFNVLPTLPSNSIDLICTDPPYLVTPMPDLVDGIDEALNGKIEWGRLFQSYRRILKDNGMIAMFGHMSTFMHVFPQFEKFNFRYCTCLVWVKHNPVNFLKAKVKPLNQHELIGIWGKGTTTYNWEEARTSGESYYRVHRHGAAGFYNVNLKDSANEGFRYMTSVLYSPSKGGLPVEERTDHPTQKPLSIVERIVKAFSFKGDVVLDSFLGSGTTLLACLRTRRNCIGVEINSAYIKMAKERVNRDSSLGGVQFEYKEM